MFVLAPFFEFYIMGGTMIALNENRLYLLFLILLGFLFAQFSLQGAGDTPPMLWQRQFEEKNRCYSHGISIWDAQKNTILIAGTSFQPGTYQNGTFWLWEINQEGKIFKDILIEKAEKDGIVDSGDLAIKGLALSKEGEILIVLCLKGYATSFVKMTYEGKILLSKEIYKEKLGVNIFKTIKTSDASLVLLGNDGLMAKINSSGEKLWEKKYDLGRDEYFTDGVPMPEKGEFIATGCSTKIEGLGFDIGSPSDVCVLKCDSNGTILSEEIFEGRRPKICKLDSGNFILVYDKDLKESIDYKIKCLDPKLKTLWEKDLIKSQEGYEPFTIASVPGGGFVIAGELEFTFYFWEFDKNGNSLNKFTLDPGNYRVCHPYIVCSDDKALIAIDSTSESNTSIDIVKMFAVKLKKNK